LEFKKKIRPLRIITIDGNVKMVNIDDSAPVRDIADAIGDKIGVRALEEFSLRKKTPQGMAKARMFFFVPITYYFFFYSYYDLLFFVPKLMLFPSLTILLLFSSFI
jgi:hypothetical protein